MKTTPSNYIDLEPQVSDYEDRMHTTKEEA